MAGLSLVCPKCPVDITIIVVEDQKFKSFKDLFRTRIAGCFTYSQMSCRYPYAVEELKYESSNMPLEAGPRAMVVIHKTESFIQNVFYAFNCTVLLFSCVYQRTQNDRSLSQ